MNIHVIGGLIVLYLLFLSAVLAIDAALDTLVQNWTRKDRNE